MSPYIAKITMLYLLCSILGLVFRSSLIYGDFPSAPAPDMITIIVVIISLRLNNAFGLLAAFALGLLADCAAGQYLGPQAASAVLSFTLTRVISGHVFVERPPGIFLLATACSVLKSTTIVVMMLFFLGSDAIRGPIVYSTLLEALCTGLLAPFIFRLLHGSSAHQAADSVIYSSPPMKRTY